MERLRRRLEQAGLDGLVVSGRQNVRYLCGFTGSAGVLVVPREPSQAAALVTDSRYTEQAARQCPGVRVVKHGDHLHETLREVVAGLSLRRVGFESDHVSYQQATLWMESITGVQWVPVEQQVESLRAVKDAGELAAMRRAIQLTDAAFRYICGVMRPGMAERTVAWKLESFLREQGADALAFPVIVASGPNGALPHATPTDRPLQPGDLVVLDFGCVIDGYHSDLTRTVMVGPDITPRAREVYELVLQAQRAGIEALGPGKTGKEVDLAARSVIEQAGLGDYFGHGLGHGIGLEVHEPVPRLNRVCDVVLEPGMVTSVEPGVYLPGWGGVRIEDLVLVTDGGCEILTGSPRELLRVGSEGP